MTTEQTRRILVALDETRQLLARYRSQKCFDSYQEAENAKRISFCESHIQRLEAMLAA